MKDVATYKSVRDEANLLFTGKVDPTTQDALALNVFINSYGREFWELYPWPEWTVAEKRQFRPDWSEAANYFAAAEVYYPPSKKYYQSLLTANSGNPPATGVSMAENSAFWAESDADYEGDTWAAGRIYTVGVRVLRYEDQRFYQCRTAHTSGATFDATKFGILTEFVRDIDYAQVFDGVALTVLGGAIKVWDQDPYTHPETARPVEKTDTDTGLIVWGQLPVVWVQFRLPAPSWTGSTWAAGAAYTVGQQVYYPTTGDYYRNTANTSSELPTNTAFWAKIEFPQVLKPAVAQAAYAMMLKSSGKTSKWAVELSEAHRLLGRQFDRMERQQGQTNQLNVMMR